MQLKLFGPGIIFPACAMLIFPLLSLFPQDYISQDHYSDEIFFEDNAGITITGTLPLSQQMAVIEKEEIEKRNAADIAGLLQETLNLGVTRYGAYGNMASINLRGFDSKRVALLVDGVPVNSAMDGKINIDQINPDSVERIEVIYGGSDTKYNVSGALGGVINIITVKKQKPGFRFGASVSNTSAMPGEYLDRNNEKQGPHWEDLLDTQNYSLSTAYGKESFSISTNAFSNRAENHFLFKNYNNRIRRKDNNEVWDAGADASFNWNFPSLARLTASSNIYYGDKNIPISGFSSNTGKQKDTSTRQKLMIDLPNVYQDKLAAEADLAYTFTSRFYESPAFAESQHNQHIITAINRWNWFPGTRLTLRSGVDYSFIYLDSTELGQRSRQYGGIYLTTEYNVHGKFLIIPSIKAALTSGSSVIPVPKLGFLWHINNSVTLKNNYFRSFKFPDFEELYWSGVNSFGNPNLRPEDGWGADLGAAWQFRELFYLESTFFTQWIRDSIHWYSKNPGIWQPENAGEAIFFGLDNKIRFEIPLSSGPFKKLIPSFSWQYLLSYLLCYGYDFNSDKKIPYMPAHILGVSLEIPWDTGSLIISCHHESLRYADTGNKTILKPYSLLNATVNQKLTKVFTAFASLKNILNESYESFYDYPMPGITLTIGLRVNLEIE